MKELRKENGQFNGSMPGSGSTNSPKPAPAAPSGAAARAESVGARPNFTTVESKDEWDGLMDTPDMFGLPVGDRGL